MGVPLARLPRGPNGDIAMHVELTESQRELLTELLLKEHRERTHELHRTDSLSYKKLLRENINMIEDLCDRIAIPEVTR